MPAIDLSLPSEDATTLPRRGRERFAPRLVHTTVGDLVSTQDQRKLRLRGIEASDVEALQRCFLRLSPEDVRRRFLHAMSELPAPMARRLCQIDSSIETALVLIDDTVVPGEIRGVGRIFVDEAADSAEFSVLVEKTWTRLGLGALLMQRLVDDCRRRGMVEIWGYVLMENRPMLDLCKALGFVRRRMDNEPGVAQIALSLR